MTIRRLYSEGHVSMLSLAQQFGVGKTTVQDIVEGRTWRRLLSTETVMFRIRDD